MQFLQEKQITKIKKKKKKKKITKKKKKKKKKSRKREEKIKQEIISLEQNLSVINLEGLEILKELQQMTEDKFKGSIIR